MLKNDNLNIFFIKIDFEEKKRKKMMALFLV